MSGAFFCVILQRNECYTRLKKRCNDQIPSDTVGDHSRVPVGLYTANPAGRGSNACTGADRHHCACCYSACNSHVGAFCQLYPNPYGHANGDHYAYTRTVGLPAAGG